MKPRILFILQLPPPYHGASIANELIIKSQLINDAFESRLIDIKTSDSIASLGKFSFSKILVSIKLFAQIFLKLVTFRPQLVHFTIAPSGFAFYRDVLYILLIKTFGRKIILHFHGKGIKTGTENSAFFRLLTRLAVSGTYTIHLSNILANDVPDYGIRKRYFVPYGVPVTAEGPGSHEIEPGKVNILFLSNYVISKGILDLIDAVEKVVATGITNLQVHLVGNAADIDNGALNTYIQNRNLQTFITVCGPRYKNEKLTTLKNASIFVLPTWYANEAFPVSLLEAMQYGLAIVTSKEGGIPDMIQDNKTGLLINQRDIDDLANKIGFLVNNKTDRKRLGDNAREAFLEKFTLSAFEKNIHHALTDALSQKPGH